MTQAATKAQELRDMVNAALKTDVLKMANDTDFSITYWPTGVYPFDQLTGGGLPAGRFCEIYGDWSTLKSYIGLKAIARVQAMGGTAALIDTEHAFDPQWAESLGVNLKDLIIEHPVTGELAIDTAEALTRGGVDLIVFDSIAATLPQDERNKRLSDNNASVARLASLMSLACRKLTSANSRTAYLWINQTRVNVGITFGSNVALPGGKAMPYYASMRLQVKKVGKVTEPIKAWDGEKWQDSKQTVGQKFQLIVEKSKLSSPHRDVWFTWDLRTGEIDNAGFIVGQALEKGTVTAKGASWSFGETKAQGREKFLDKVRNDPQLFDRIVQSLQPKPPKSSTSPGRRIVRRSKVARKKPAS